MTRRSSKTRSGTSSRLGRLPRLPPIYIDESVSQRYVAEALRAHDLKVIIRKDMFPEGVDDPAWLLKAGASGWIVLTKDKEIRRRPNEILAFYNAGVRAFILAAGGLTGPDQAELFVRALPTIRRFVAEHGKPFAVRLMKDGTAELLARPTMPRRAPID